ncbi:ubiquinone biosynthesis accessory factor UbiJ [Alteromonas oceanisediminis]|uniref:ubiquinone biosynthesis accessory factor UbiJ n=1 Tax=Alteromonas oceanisediminis TaxID=2836180 RepID=UPI001BD97A74|nr:SCP2 sterol-binding domain-containing protein [Alteromonas oceanisediminis]MBT0587733.1 SCP2 sterol-binding domain-containing protein [Alteromonas oceanisediminis]
MPTAQLVLGAVEPVINRALALDPQTRERMAKLHGKRLIIWLEESPWPIELAFEHTVSLHQYMSTWEHANACDNGQECRLKLALSILPTLQDSRQITRLIREGKLDLEGDIHIAQHASALFQQLSIDWEEVLSTYVGDVAAHHVVRSVKTAKQVLKNQHENALQTLGTALIDEKKLAAHKLQVMHFSDQVSDTRNAVERLAARVAQLDGR